MELREFGPDDCEAVKEYVGVEEAARLLDRPWREPLTPYRQRMSMVHGWDGDPVRFFLARADGRTVGAAQLEEPTWDNRDLAWLGVTVHPSQRRRGHGRAIVAALLERCRADGRPLVGIDGEDVAAVHAFATAMGFAAKSVAVERRQRLRELPAGLLDTLAVECAPYAGDYELLRIAGRTPRTWLPRLSVAAASINDAPLDDLELEDDDYSVEHIAAYESAQIDADRRLYRLLAVHRASGEVGGHTVVVVDADQPEWGYQHDTAVARAHRGRRLGLLLKTEMCRWLLDAEPGLRTVDTWNARSNDHMVPINERLGYRVSGTTVEFQQRLG